MHILPVGIIEMFHIFVSRSLPVIIIHTSNNQGALSKAYFRDTIIDP